MEYAGMVNPGCLCYLNSAMQQLFMIPSFRESILSLPLSPNVNIKSSSFLSALQNLFRGLESARAENLRSLEQLEDMITFSSLKNIKQVEAINPLPLSCLIWDPLGESEEGKDSGEQGNYLDPDEQMDVSEFLSCFLSQLSSSLQSCHPLLQIGRSICGEINNEMRANNEDGIRGLDSSSRIRTNEQFFFLSVKVGNVRTSATSLSASCLPCKHIGNLHDALDDFTGYEAVNAMWSRGVGDCRERVLLPSTNTCTLSAASLPPHLFFHLKRFRFDRSKMRQVKVSSRFEFPFEDKKSSCLDLWRHTTEGRREQEEDLEWERNMREGNNSLDHDAETCDISAKGCCKYVLSGVIVHAGTALDGHYFSLIRERQGQHEKSDRSMSGSVQPSRWLKMDDEEVIEFNLADMDREAFGGPEETWDDDEEVSPDRKRKKRQSAFMLIYDKVWGAMRLLSPHRRVSGMEYAGSIVLPSSSSFSLDKPMSEKRSS